MEGITFYIPTGSKNAVSRAELSQMTGLSDRAVRREIHAARRDTPIINMSDGSGYFIPDDSPEDQHILQMFVNQETARLKSIGWALKSARKAVRDGSKDHPAN